MNIYSGMKNGTKEHLEMIEKEIFSELAPKGTRDIFNRKEYYTKKFKGDRLLDVNVGIWEEANNEFILQIFVRNKEGFIRRHYKAKTYSDKELIKIDYDKEYPRFGEYRG